MDEVKINKPDWYLRYSWLLILIIVLILLTYYNINSINSCTARPLDYAIDKYHEAYGDKYKFSGSLNVVGQFVGFSVPFGDVDNKSIIVTKNELEEEIPSIFNFSNIQR